MLLRNGLGFSEVFQSITHSTPLQTRKWAVSIVEVVRNIKSNMEKVQSTFSANQDIYL